MTSVEKPLKSLKLRRSKAYLPTIDNGGFDCKSVSSAGVRSCHHGAPSLLSHSAVASYQDIMFSHTSYQVTPPCLYISAEAEVTELQRKHDVFVTDRTSHKFSEPPKYPKINYP